MATPTPSMPTVTLGSTGITTSRLSIGTWGFGTASAKEARQTDEQTLVDVLRAAFDAGVRYVDSAEVYDNEDRLAKLLEAADAPADVIIASKFGHGKGFTGDLLRASVERSLEQLGIDRLPVMMVHDPRNEDDMKVVLGKGGALEALRDLQDQGLVGATGVATGTFGPLRMAVDSGEFDCIQFPRLFTLLNQASRTTGLLEDAKAKGMATLNPSPFGGNILATGTRPGALYVFRPALPEVLEAVRRMETRCRELGVTLPAAAMAFSLTEPLVDVTIVGVVNTQELAWDLEALSLTLTRAELESIAEAGAIDPALLGGPDFVTSWPADRIPPVPAR